MRTEVVDLLTDKRKETFRKIYPKTNREAERLKKSVDILRVLDYCGVETQKKGSAYFLRCPDQEHQDHAPYRNCYCHEGWSNVLCKRCGKAFNAADLIMAEKKCDYGTAMDILWELAGKPEWYQSRRGKPADPSPVLFELTREERRLLGIQLPISYSIPCSKQEGDHAGQESRARLCRSDFMAEKDYIYMVQEKAAEKIREMEEIKKEIAMAKKTVKYPEDDELTLAADEAVRVCREIMIRCRTDLRGKQQ
jgi:hypothetical protein